MKREPEPSDAGTPLVEAIRRINLDAFWANESGTISGTAAKVRTMLRTQNQYGFRIGLPRMGPFPTTDTFGYGLAIVTVLDSLEGGRYASTKQFATVRHFRSAFGSVWDASSEAVHLDFSTISDDKKHSQRFTQSPSSSFWFKKFMTGMALRMGATVKQDMAITPTLARAVSYHALQHARNPTHPLRREMLLLGGAVNIGFVGGLRGPELFLMDVAGTKAHIEKGKNLSGAKAHVIMALLGRFKGESGERFHLIPMASKTRSGFTPRWWFEILLSLCESEHRSHGPILAKEGGEGYSLKEMNEIFWIVLEELQEDRPELFGGPVDIRDTYSLMRSLRRGSDTEAVRLKIDNKAIDLMHRWSTVESARGKQASMPMRDHYAQVCLLLDLYLDFSYPL